MADFGDINRTRRTFGDPTPLGDELPGSLSGLALMAAAPNPEEHQEEGMFTPDGLEEPASQPVAPMPSTTAQVGSRADHTVPFHIDRGAPTAPVFDGGENNNPNFQFVEIGDDVVFDFCKEYNPTIKVATCIADKGMLLQYMVQTERRYNITMSFPAYGVDPIVFDEMVKEARARAEAPEEVPPIVEIPVAGRSKVQGDGENERPAEELYEKIEVDGVLYLSCISECLDRDYLHKVIAEATEAIYVHGQYVFTMVGPRPLTIDGEAQGEFLETLKLNSYELSVLLSYMQKIDGVRVEYGVFDGRSAIRFRR